MKTCLTTTFLLFCVGFSLSALPTRTPEQRERILEITRSVLDRAPKDNYAEVLASIPSPFQFPRTVPIQDTGPKFTDSQILRRVGITLRPRIRGIIGRGDTFFLQTAAGRLFREGEKFGVTVRQLSDDRIEIEIGKITNDGFVLKFNDVEAYFPFYEE